MERASTKSGSIPERLQVGLFGLADVSKDLSHVVVRLCILRLEGQHTSKTLQTFRPMLGFKKCPSEIEVPVGGVGKKQSSLSIEHQSFVYLALGFRACPSL